MKNINLLIILLSLYFGTSSDIFAENTPSSDIDLSETVDLFSQAKNQPAKINHESSTVIVRVNGEDITFGEIQKEMTARLEQFRGQISPEQLPQVQQQVTDRIAALEKVIETQRATMEEALSGIKEQLEEARGDLDYINQRME